jgi:hypothetical protein
MGRIFGVILLAGFLTVSLANAEPYTEKSFPSNDIITQNILQLLQYRIETEKQRIENLKIDNILGKFDKGDGVSRVLFCSIYTTQDPLTGRKSEAGSCNAVDVFRLDTGIWIIESDGVYWVIRK